MGSSHIMFPYLKIKNKILNIKELGGKPSWKVKDVYLLDIENLKAIQFCLQLLKMVLCKQQGENETGVV